MMLEKFLPNYDLIMHHEIVVADSPENVYTNFMRLDFSQSRIISWLIRLRGLQKIDPQSFVKYFTKLYEEKPSEIIWGLIACPWKLRVHPREFDPAQFTQFNEKGYAKIAWNFTFRPTEKGTLVTTETRILCTDDNSCWKMRLYWFFVRPFAGLLRKEMLRLLAKTSGTSV